MQERAIQISSINRHEIRRNQPEDFIIKFEPPINFERNMNHELAVDRVTMTYSWHYINKEYTE